MLKNFVVLFMLMSLALSVAGAKTYSVTLFQPSVVGGAELKPGDYQLDLDNSKVIIRNSKQSVEAEVKLETSDAKFTSTSVRYASGDGKNRIQEIRLGGTKIKLIFN